MYKDNNTNNKSSRPNNAYNYTGDNNNSCIFQNIIKRITAEH